MKITALLPIKHHSERVPNKNFRTLGWSPLYRWILETICSMPEIDQVVINTDSDLVSASGLSRVSIRRRKKELCGNDVDMNRIIADDVEAFPSDIYIQTHATNPFISSNTIRRALAEFRKGTHDSLFSVNAVQVRYYDHLGRAINHDPEHLIPTQDLQPIYQENSCLYIFSQASFVYHRKRIGAHPLMFETPVDESLDIDNEDNFKLAQALAQ